MKLYFDFASEPSRAVYLFLKYNDVDFEPQIVDLIKGEYKSPEYKNVNPFQLVPAIDDDGFILTESIAILRYIATKYNAAEHWFPKEDVQKQARVDEFLNWYHTNLRKSNVKLLVTNLQTRMALGADYPKIPRDAEKIKGLQDSLKKTLNSIDEYFLRGKPFTAGDEISAADLIGYSELSNQAMTETEDETYKSNENVNAWMSRVAAKLEKFTAEPLAVVAQYKALYDNAKE